MKTLFLLVFILTLHHETNSCVFRKRDGPDPDNHWDIMTFERKIDSSNCECGKPIDFSGPLPWNVEVRTTSDDGTVKNCTGTIVASNLIVTSHQCLEQKGKKMLIYDLFNIKHGDKHLAGNDKISVTSAKDAGKTFTVLNIFPNPQYALSSQKKIYPENDVVIIKVEANFITESDFTPICLPFFESKFDDSDIENQQGTYYGEADASKPGHVVIFSGDIVKKYVCYDEINVHDKNEFEQKSGNRTLCLKFPGGKTNPPKVEGGPLIVKVENKNAFLVGIADSVKDADKMEARGGLAGSVGEDFSYFSGINPVIKFIEFFAEKEKSTWCKTPDGKVLNLSAGKKGGAEPKIRRQKPWPWDLMGDVARDDSLDCLCGLQNTKIMGRVVGGVEATPREFGWMTVINLYINGKKSGASLCGGSVINDRMILTAAHCVVNDRSLEKHPEKDPTILPENVQVTLNSHLQRNDPEGVEKEVVAVLFHPDYLDGRQASPEFYDSDVALLVLKDRLVFPPNTQKGIRPICLPKRGERMEVVGKNAWVVGWGLTDPQNRRSTASKLQKLEIPIAELKYCSDVATSKVTENNICAGTLNMYKDAASGDSGGPLQLEDSSTSRWFEVGLVSWGEDVEKNGDTQTAALYADVQKLMPFIDYHAQRIQAKWCKQKE